MRPRSHFIQQAFLAFTVIFLAACTTTRYEYVLPATEQGRICITHCAGNREICHGNEMQRAQMEKNSCEMRSESTYRSCLRHANNKDEAKKCHRPGCWASENTWRCDQDYRQCFSNCGGIVHTITEEM